MRKTSKLSEVAKLAGVGPTTASRAIRGSGYVSEETRARIMAAAAQLNYQPDMLARRMRGDKSKLLGVFVNSYGPVVLHEIIRHIGDEARRLGYDLLTFGAERFDSPQRQATAEMLTKLCDGILLIMPQHEDSYLKLIEQQNLPCVVVGFDARPLDVPVVVADNRAGARTAVEHLISLGHRRIGFLAGNPGTGQSHARQQGYQAALEAAGIPFDPQLVENGAFIQPGGFAATEKLLARDPRPTAIFAANDEMAFGALDAISSKGLKVPADIAVIGFDDIPTASFVYPKLSTMAQPFQAMAARAVNEVIRLIDGDPRSGLRLAFPLKLVVRDSTGPA